jgi:hypothetical protein
VPSDPATPPRRGGREEAVRQRQRARRGERYDSVPALHRQGRSVHGIAAVLARRRTTVQRYLQADGFPEIVPRAKRSSLLDPDRPYLEARWAEAAGMGASSSST